MVQNANSNLEDLPTFFSPKMIAPILGVSATHAYRIASQKNFPHVKFGKRIVIHKDSFILWIKDTFSTNQHLEKETKSNGKRKKS